MRLDGDNTFVRIDQDPQTAGDNDGIPANLYKKLGFATDFSELDSIII